jgi:hypothetical protein
MKARQLIGGTAFPPDELTVIFGAFDDAWAEVAADVSSDAQSVETARMTLAGIVLTLARVGPLDRMGLKNAAVDAFRQMHHLGHQSSADG